jgi:hypothetical protein
MLAVEVAVFMEQHQQILNLALVAQVAVVMEVTLVSVFQELLAQEAAVVVDIGHHHQVLLVVDQVVLVLLF